MSETGTPSAAEVAGIAKNAKMTAAIADFAKISDRELRPVEQLAQIEPVIISGHRIIGRPHAVVAVADQRIEVAVEQHPERDPADHPGATGDASPDTMLDAPVAQSPF